MSNAFVSQKFVIFSEQILGGRYLRRPFNQFDDIHTSCNEDLLVLN